MVDSSRIQNDTDVIEDSLVFSPMALISILCGALGIFSSRFSGFLFFSALGILLSVAALLFAKRWVLSSVAQIMAVVGLAISIFGVTYLIASQNSQQAVLSEFATEQASDYLEILQKGDYEKAFRLSRDQRTLSFETEKHYSTVGYSSKLIDPFLRDPMINMIMKKKDASWTPTGDVRFENIEDAVRYTVDFVDEKVASKRVMEVRMVREYPYKVQPDGSRAYFWHVDSVRWQL